MGSSQSALSDIVVLDLSRMLPGPFCSMLLGDHGARIIQIEALPGTAEKAPFVEFPTLHRNKEHLHLNLKHEKGRRIGFQLLERADVFLEGFRPGVMKRLGMDYESAKAVNSRIIYCSISGYGQQGDRSGRSGHDVNYLSESGLLDLMRSEEGRPILPSIQMADLAGGLYATVGILLALHHREKTGEGQYIDVSMTDSALSLAVSAMSFASAGMPHRCGQSPLSGGLACYSIYETEGGDSIAVGALEPRFFRRLCELLGVGRLAEAQYDPSRQDEIREVLAGIFLSKPAEAWCGLLQDEDVCVTPVSRFERAIEDPDFRGRGMIATLQTGDTDRPLLGPLPKLSAAPGTIRTAPPRGGGHTDRILAELGHTPEDIRILRSQGIVA